MRPIQHRIHHRAVWWLLGILLAAAPWALVPIWDSKNVRQAVANGRRELPPLMLWAWQRGEDLSFLDPSEAGVAFLLATVEWSDSGFTVHPRMQGLHVPEGAMMEAVVRIETDPAAPPGFTPEECHRLAAQIVSLAARTSVSRLQLDFDARRSERRGYRLLLAGVRRKWPHPLSITALASWCLYDDWITDLPVDAAVPMLFEMGPDREGILSLLRSGAQFPVAKARSNWGISTDELEFDPPLGVRLYVFHSRPWSRSAFEEFERWLK